MKTSILVLVNPLHIRTRSAQRSGFTNPTVVFTGSKLLLNVDNPATGNVRVGLLDENG